MFIIPPIACAPSEKGALPRKISIFSIVSIGILAMFTPPPSGLLIGIPSIKIATCSDEEPRIDSVAYSSSPPYFFNCMPGILSNSSISETDFSLICSFVIISMFE